MDVDLHMSLYMHNIGTTLFLTAINHNLCYRMVMYTTQTYDMFPWIFSLHIVFHKNKNDSEVNLQHHWVPGHFQVGKVAEAWNWPLSPI